MKCEMCGQVATPAFEVIVREVQRRNVPLTQLTVCKRCAFGVVLEVDGRRIVTGQ